MTVMQRFKITIEYDGRPFVGWQMQKNGPSVQHALTEAIAAFTNEDVLVQGAGRTDAGVHATGQVAHVEIEKPMAAHQVQGALNHHLKPHPISALKVEAVEDSFHARFSATGRAYRYRIINRRAPLSFDKGLAWHVARPLDAQAMHEAAQYLVGRHDFTTFRHVACQAKSPVKTLDLLMVERQGEEIIVHVAARSFLHHQVRSMVGTLELVGAGKWAPQQVQEALLAQDRRALGFNAPPDGLYLSRVRYDTPSMPRDKTTVG
ncbi:tRNA pseudouridine synthase A [Iodidimonas gelatinilytica]|uniref:tRNA pseudouridine synthase A n=2 Tax=Iodidimonas gelatinilytica TaxID=1236966 RepID=A0A5A7MZV3_9PROT|nr:tRNA pseudouridine synthase A [Iodidimonas gelatinilytica]